jgi:hypothetical protein
MDQRDLAGPPSGDDLSACAARHGTMVSLQEDLTAIQEPSALAEICFSLEGW